MAISDVNPYVRHALYDIVKTDFQINRSIWDYELIFIVEGQMRINLKNHSFIAKKNDIVFIRPGIQHIILKDSPTLIQPHVHFDLFKKKDSAKIWISFVEEKNMTDTERKYFRHDDLAKYGLDKCPLIVHSTENSNFLKTLTEITTQIRYHQQYQDAILSGLMKKLLAEYLMECDRSHEDPRYRKSKISYDLQSYIIDNFKRNPSIDELAAYCHMSKPYFLAKFKDFYGTSPHKYIDKMRYNYAADLLANFNRMSIDDIIEELNFHSRQDFSRWFSNKSGSISPSKYRKMNRNK